MEYESLLRVESRLEPGVTYRLARMSFGRRLELAKKIRVLAQRAEFLAAGNDPQQHMDAAVLSAEIDRIYLLWGVQAVEGLELDGAPATPESLLECGPEGLAREALAAVKSECGLSQDERGN